MGLRRQLVAAALAGASLVALMGACGPPAPKDVPPIVADCQPNGDPCYGSEPVPCPAPGTYIGDCTGARR